jgi:hypothetical protein
LSTRAVYSFIGFPSADGKSADGKSAQECHFYLHHDGYPSGAARRFEAALRQEGAASAFLAAFLSSQPQAEALARVEQAADAEYRYRLRLLPSADPQLQVQCWRRIPGGGSWHCHCGPMALTAFINRFLSDDLHLLPGN